MRVRNHRASTAEPNWLKWGLLFLAMAALGATPAPWCAGWQGARPVGRRLALFAGALLRSTSFCGRSMRSGDQYLTIAIFAVVVPLADEDAGAVRISRLRRRCRELPGLGRTDRPDGTRAYLSAGSLPRLSARLPLCAVDCRHQWRGCWAPAWATSAASSSKARRWWPMLSWRSSCSLTVRRSEYRKLGISRAGDGGAQSGAPVRQRHLGSKRFGLDAARDVALRWWPL